jgi:hypothetical protein
MTVYGGQVTSYYVYIFPSSNYPNVATFGSRFINFQVDVDSGQPGAPGFLATVFFFPSGQAIPNSTVSMAPADEADAVSTVVLNTSIDDYEAIVDLLRNESFVGCYVDDASPNDWSFYTTGLNVGQGQVMKSAVTPAKLPPALSLPPELVGRVTRWLPK